MDKGKAVLKRAVLEVLGWGLVAGGIAAIFLPGPGLLMLFGGLAILSQQYEWAERRVRPVERAAMKAASDGVQTWTRVALSLLGVCWLAAMGVLWYVEPGLARLVAAAGADVAARRPRPPGSRWSPPR